MSNEKIQNKKQKIQKEITMKFLKISAILIFSSSLVFATSTEDFFYQRGYENGYVSGYEKGVQEAFKEAKAMLSKYSDSLKSYEIGKYLIKNQNLTYPQVWQEVGSDGILKLRVLPSEITKELNVESLFSKFATIPTLKESPQTSLSLSVEERNAVLLNARDSNSNHLSQSVKEQANKQTLQIKKSAKNLDILKRANVVFSDEGDFYNVLFFTNTERQDFCRQFEICK